jgi:hypothetical protein
MYKYKISPFDDTMTAEDLQQEVAEYLEDSVSNGRVYLIGRFLYDFTRNY